MRPFSTLCIGCHLLSYGRVSMVIKEIEVKDIMTKTNLPVVCNYFYHEEITKSAKKEKKA